MAEAQGGGAAARRRRRLPALRPLSVRRQGPTAWSAVFAPETVAVLYGARLGVGPLTILPTWLWWAAMALGATTGAWGGAAVGAAFALSRAATSLLAAEAIAGRHAQRMPRLAAASGPVAVVVGLAAAAITAAGTLAPG